MKKVLLLGDDRTNLITPILNRMERMGFQVDYIDASELDAQKKYPSFLHKLLAKCFLNRHIKGKRHWGRESYIESRSEGHYDHVVVLIPAMLNSLIAEKLRAKTESLICILWDSLNKAPSGDVLLEYADRVFSFDKEDCAIPEVRHLPSYHLPQVDYSKQEQTDIFGVFTVGKMSDPRYKVVTQIAENNPELNGEVVLISDIVSPKVIEKNNITIIFQKEKLLGEALEEKIKSCRMLLDIVDPKQKGLSFRLADAYRYRKLLVTNNQSICDEQWFSPNYYLQDNGVIDKDFIGQTYSEVETPYTLDNWIRTIFE